MRKKERKIEQERKNNVDNELHREEGETKKGVPGRSIRVTE